MSLLIVGFYLAQKPLLGHQFLFSDVSSEIHILPMAGAPSSVSGPLTS